MPSHRSSRTRLSGRPGAVLLLVLVSCAVITVPSKKAPGAKLALCRDPACIWGDFVYRITSERCCQKHGVCEFARPQQAFTVRCFAEGCEQPVTVSSFDPVRHTKQTLRCTTHRGTP
jgi:hypothetical protein